MKTAGIIFLKISAAKYDLQALQTLLGNYTPRLEPCLPAGFFLDFSGESRIKDYLTAMCRELPGYLGSEFCLGLGYNKLIARQIAEAGGSNRLKPHLATAAPYLVHKLPDGRSPLWYVKDLQLSRFVGALPVSSLWPCPPEVIAKLDKLGVHYNYQLTQIPADQLEYHFGYWGGLLYQYSRGQDPSPVRSGRAEKELSYSRILTQPTVSFQVVEAAVAEGARYIAHKLAEEQAGFLELVCYFYLNNKETILKRGFNQPQSSRTAIRDNAMLLIRGGLNPPQPLYGLKLSVRSITPQSSRQLALFQHPQLLKSAEAEGHYRLEQALLSLHKRFSTQVLCLGRDVSISRREQMLQLLDPFRKENNRNGGVAYGQVCPQSAESSV